MERISGSAQRILVVTAAALLLGALLPLTYWREARRRRTPQRGETMSQWESDPDEQEMDITVQALDDPRPGLSQDGEASEGS